MSASCGIEPTRTIAYKPFLDGAIERSSHKPSGASSLQRPQLAAELGERDIEWQQVMAGGGTGRLRRRGCHRSALHPLHLRHDRPTQGIVRDNGGHAVALAWSMANIYDIGPGDVWFTASDVGWVVGHSYIVYAPLLVGATTVVYEGKPVGTTRRERVLADPRRLRREGDVHRPTAYRAIRKDPQRLPQGRGTTCPTSSKRSSLAGERLDPDTYGGRARPLGVPVVDNWWQTETGWPIAANLRGLEPMPIKPGSPSVRVPGYDVQVLDDTGQPVPAGQEGRSRSNCRCPRAPCRPCGGTTSVMCRATCRSTTATT